MSAHSSVSQVIRKCYAAYQTGDRGAIEPLLSEDFTFTSPLDDHIDRAAYFSRCWPNSEHIRAFTIESSLSGVTRRSSYTSSTLPKATRFETPSFSSSGETRSAKSRSFSGRKSGLSEVEPARRTEAQLSRSALTSCGRLLPAGSTFSR